MIRALLALLLYLSFASPVAAQRFVAVAFHDVIDDERDLGTDDIVTPQLVAFLTGYVAMTGCRYRSTTSRPLVAACDRCPQRPSC